jgi:hypothetical protein
MDLESTSDMFYVIKHFTDRGDVCAGAFEITASHHGNTRTHVIQDKSARIARPRKLICQTGSNRPILTALLNHFPSHWMNREGLELGGFDCAHGAPREVCHAPQLAHWHPFDDLIRASYAPLEFKLGLILFQSAPRQLHMFSAGFK